MDRSLPNGGPAPILNATAGGGRRGVKMTVDGAEVPIGSEVLVTMIVEVRVDLPGTGRLQYKERELTFRDGYLEDVGPISNWITFHQAGEC